MKKSALFLSLFLVFYNVVSAFAFNTSSDYMIVRDADSGAVYYERNADVPLAPASMTKVMTVYLIYEEISKGNLSKDTLITADEQDYLSSKDPIATNVLLKEGMQYSVDDLISAILVPSACAAAAMVGKYIDGSEQAFAQHMTRRAAEMGLTAYFEDASGLSDNNRITPRSMAELTSEFISRYPDVLNYTSKSQIVFDGKLYKSTNRMLPGADCNYWGTDGFKTGTTTLAGACFSSTAKRDDTRLVSVVMHSAYGASRFEDTKQLLDFGFSEANVRKNNLYATDISTFINGFEIPSFIYKGGKDNKLVIIAEDLANYGFNTSWNPQTMTFSAFYNSKTAVTAMNMESYRGYRLDTPIICIYPLGNLKVSVGEYLFKDLYNLNGYIAISADELGGLAKSLFWDNERKSLYIEF